MTTVYTPETAATIAAKLFSADLGVAGLFSRDLEADFGGGSGSTVRVRVPGVVEASTRDARDLTTPLVQSSLVENTIAVDLDVMAYSSIPLGVGHYDLDLTDFSAQVLRPQADAIRKYVTREAVEALQATPESTAITYDAALPARTFTAIRRTLRSNGVSAEEPIFAIVGSDVYADLLDAEPAKGHGFDENGITVRGIAVTESTRLDPSEIVAFVKPAFVLVMRAPSVPEGAPYGASVAVEEGAVTALRVFDAGTATDRSIVQALVAVQAMPLTVDQEDGTVALVPHGGAVRVLTAA